MEFSTYTVSGPSIVPDTLVAIRSGDENSYVSRVYSKTEGFSPEKYVKIVNVQDWDTSQSEPFFIIPITLHKRGHCPDVCFYSDSYPYAEIGVYYTISPEGSIIIKTRPNLLFSFKVIIS